MPPAAIRAALGVGAWTNDMAFVPVAVREDIHKTTSFVGRAVLCGGLKGDMTTDERDEWTNASYLNRIERHFTALRYIAVGSTDHRSHQEQNSMMPPGDETRVHLRNDHGSGRAR
jgi:hypothetical protein